MPWLLSFISIVIIIAVIENISVFCIFSISWKSNILIIVVYYSQTCYNHRHFNELNASDKMSFYINFYHWRSTLFHPHHALSLLPFKTHSFCSRGNEHKSPTQRISPQRHASAVTSWHLTADPRERLYHVGLTPPSVLWLSAQSSPEPRTPRRRALYGLPGVI